MPESPECILADYLDDDMGELDVASVSAELKALAAAMELAADAPVLHTALADRRRALAYAAIAHLARLQEETP